MNVTQPATVMKMTMMSIQTTTQPATTRPAHVTMTMPNDFVGREIVNVTTTLEQRSS